MTLLEQMREYRAKRPVSSFAPKLNAGQRIALFALYQEGATTMQLARLFGVHRNTVYHITDQNSTRYHRTRAEYYGMGAEQAFEKHVTPDMVNALTALQAENSGTPARDHEGPNAKANQRQGKWENEMGEPFKVEWVADDYGPMFFGPGWYPIYDDQCALPMGRDKPYNTSAEAYRAGRTL
jgi:hypothetical protein